MAQYKQDLIDLNFEMKMEFIPGYFCAKIDEMQKIKNLLEIK